ncbi:MAG: WD40 repeat domain-containing protein [Gemmataceae bacterium]
MLPTLAVLLCTQSLAAAPPPPLLRDHDGDPLPRGAVARLGTKRFRDGFADMPFVLTPDGRSLVTLRHNRLATMDLLTGKAARRLEGVPANGDPRTQIAVFPEGNRLLCFGERDVRVLDLATGKLLRTWVIEGEVGRGVLALRHDGRQVAVGTSGETGGRVQVLDTTTGRRLQDIHVGDHHVSALALTHDGRSLSVVSAFHVQQIDVATGKTQRSRYLDSTHSAEPSSDGAHYLLTSEGVRLHDWAGGKPRELVRAGDKGMASFSPDGKLVVVARPAEGGVSISEASTGRLVRELKIPGLRQAEGGRLLLAPRGGTLVGTLGRRAETYPAPRAFLCWDAVTGEPRPGIEGHLRAVGAMGFSADGKVLMAVAAWDGVYRWDTATGRLLSRMDAGGALWEWLLAANGERVLNAKTGQLFDTDTGRESFRLSGHSEHSVVAVAGDGGALATFNFPNRLTVWDLAKGKAVGDLPTTDGTRNALTFSPGHRFLFDGYRTVWEVNGKTLWMTLAHLPLEEISGFGGSNGQYLFSPDGRYLFFTNPGRWQGWDLNTRLEVKPAEVLGNPIRKTLYGHRFSPDGRLLVAQDDDGLHLWEASSGSVLHRVGDPLTVLAFSPCGRRIATARQDELSILLWDLPALVGVGDVAPRADLASPDASAATRPPGWPRSRVASPCWPGRLRRPRRCPGPARQAARRPRRRSHEQRQRPRRRCWALGDPARPGLERLLRPGADLEARRRAERMLRELVRPGDPERLRERRAVMALELAGGADARALLRRLAAGLPTAFLTREARAALARLDRTSRPTSP